MSQVQEITWHTTFSNSYARKNGKKKNAIKKSFNTINEGLLLAKLKACGFSKQY